MTNKTQNNEVYRTEVLIVPGLPRPSFISSGELDSSTFKHRSLKNQVSAVSYLDHRIADLAYSLSAESGRTIKLSLEVK